jgi:hypothetical protein
MLSAAFSGAFNVANKGATGFINAMKQAASIQSSSIATAGDFMKMTGQSFAEASKFVDGFSTRMADMASKLPGQTQDYVRMGRSITDNLIPAFKQLDGSLNTEEFSQALDEITRDATLRAVNTGTDINLAALGISRLLSGGSLSELQRLKFFEDNPAVFSFLEDEARKLGRNIEDMSKRERVEVLRRALAVPDEVIKASTESIGGMVEGVRSSLLDPNVGLFGLLRDLDPAKEGTQSVESAARELLQYVLGPLGPFSRLTEVFDRVGLGVDPMAGLYRFLNWMTDLVGSLNELVDSTEPFLERLSWSINGIGTTFRDLEKAAEAYTFAPGERRRLMFSPKARRELVDDLWNTGGHPWELGNEYARHFQNYIRNAVSGDVAYGLIGESIATEINYLLNNLQYSLLLPNIAQGLGMEVAYLVNKLSANIFGFLRTLDWGFVAKSLGGALITGLVNFFNSLSLESYLLIAALAVLPLLAGLILAPIVGAIAALGAGGAALIAGGLVVMGGLISLAWSKTQDSWGKFTNTLSNLGDRINRFRTNLRSTIINKLRDITDAITDLFGWIWRRIRQLIPGADGGTGQSASGIGANLRNLPDAGVFLRPSFNGFIPPALQQEMRNKPPGSDLLVANSSELVLNQAQQRALFRGSRTTSITFAGGIHINAGNAGDPRQMANLVIAEIERKLSQAKFQLA